ncbi:MAG: adenylate kinase [Chloroflexi bacterium]|nr:adenylate kinase [Chloroflexota bacterium]
MGSPRIVIVGSTGAGKTTLARHLSRLLDVSHIELDALNWEANWITAPTDVFRQRVWNALVGETWVVDGNYSAVRDLVWPRATALIWLDYPLRVLAWRLLRRTLRRTLRKEELWNGNRERFLAQFLSRDSLFLWLLRTYWRRRRNYPLLLEQPEHSHLEVVHLRSQGETRVWLSTLMMER